MKRIQCITAGESHGPALSVIIHGLPAGFQLNVDEINHQLSRRQKGYGRGGRMTIEKDQVEILSGLRNSITLGSPLSCIIRNRDFENWKETMDPVQADVSEKISIPRPGHADYAGMLKYKTDDLRNILERASARETAVRTVAGAICRQFLENVGISFHSVVTQIGIAGMDPANLPPITEWNQAENSPVRCPDPKTEKRMMEVIDTARKEGDSLGGLFRVVVQNLPVGLGSHTQWNERLTSMISAHILGIPAIRGIEFGLGFKVAEIPGSRVHDPFEIKDGKIIRSTNHSGGIEGGMSNGCDLIFSAVMKPIPTLAKPLASVDLKTGKQTYAHKERTDSCAVPAASVVAENVTAIPLLEAFLMKFGGDSWDETLKHRDASQ
ncbi:TPA: chorismate synthase [Candidatus Marinimicrobia bacterium]|nr:MAG: Chorismate synthase [Marinimicrobia bacterium 46_47]KUK91771.1 MAG: chorismate synthase [Marinimicrobia bacterium 46_43]HAE87592.1 chorismate synthase [Candidatus Neomarinimicrobiota bacterium]HBY18160.1 chorismate synthase [Candidatus Neomarinimicrobiota bacterium]